MRIRNITNSDEKENNIIKHSPMKLFRCSISANAMCNLKVSDKEISEYCYILLPFHTVNAEFGFRTRTVGF